MIHSRRDGGYTAYYAGFSLAAVAIALTVALAIAGSVAVRFAVPWKGIVTLLVIAIVVGASHLRTRRRA